ncbi:MAG: rhamnulokinase family protein [Faecousia sp.]
MSSHLAFDFGASSGRAILGTYENGKLTYREIHRFPNTLVQEDGKLCWDFPHLMEEVRKAVELCGKADSLGFDTWGVDYGLLDEHGQLMGLPVSYRDTRTEGMPQKVFEKIPPETVYAATGNQIMPINTLFQLMAESKRTGKTMLFMPDLFAWALCGAVSTEKTIASTSQMLDPRTGKWNHLLTEVTGFDEGLFQEIVDSATFCGEYKGIRVIKVAGHDTQCAVAAMPCSGQEEAAFLSCGTWSLIGCELDEPILTKQSMLDELSNELGANGKVNYLKNISGLWLIQEIRRNFRDEGRDYSYNDMEQLARQEPAFACFIDPDAPEFGVPGDIPGKIRAFCRRTGQSVPESDGALVRCIYESLSAKYRYAIEQIAQNTGKHFEVLHLLGGGTKDSFLCQMTADSLGIPVIAGPAEATALGNILLQLVAMGEIPDLAYGRQLIRTQEAVTVYSPVHRSGSEAAYEKFCAIMRQ